SSVAAGSKLWRVLMFRHMNGKLAAVLLGRDRLRLRLDQSEPHDRHGLVVGEAPAGLAQQDGRLVAAAVIEAALVRAPLVEGARPSRRRSRGRTRGTARAHRATAIVESPP